ncbi:MAG: crossover junction endodeoxyribonuclease RuvC [Deltaproteobacteria bacterium]|nr:crossover junction endodeoxyribonuclease RuvC [Deltaproteobacteria bacterium]
MRSLSPKRRIMAVDPSLTCSGWALFGVVPDRPGQGSLLAVGKIRSLSPQHALAARFKDLQEKISMVCEELKLCGNDVLICESQTTMRDPRAAFKVEQVRGIFETVARSRSLSVPGRINPRTVQSEIMGLRGKQLARDIVKDTALHIVKTVYGPSLEALGFPADHENLSRNQDIVDAILIGSLALTRFGTAAMGGLELEETLLPRARRVGKRLPR